MADSHIDPWETVIYGRYACEQLRARALGLLADLDDAVRFAIDTQKRADRVMGAMLERHGALPDAGVLAEDDPLPAARAAIVALGRHLAGAPGPALEPGLFFGASTPEAVAQRKPALVRAAVEQLAGTLATHAGRLPEGDTWVARFRDLSARLAVHEARVRDARRHPSRWSPELSQARLDWLAVYAANKLLVAGVLAHAGRPELLPDIFDDLSDAPRTAGVVHESAPLEDERAEGDAT